MSLFISTGNENTNNNFNCSLSIEALSSMYCNQPASKKQKLEDSETYTDTQDEHNIAILDTSTDQKAKSPILENKERSFKKCLQNNSYSVLKKLSRFPRTVLDSNVIESKFFNSVDIEQVVIEESPEKSVNPFKVQSKSVDHLEIDTACSDIEMMLSSQKENSLSPSSNSVDTNSPSNSSVNNSPKSRNPFKMISDTQTSSDTGFSESIVDSDNVIEDSQVSCINYYSL